MTLKPDYYENIRRTAEQRWEQLECDPEMRALWETMFRQVQSPRHVISELLQNADDAGATEVFVRIENQTFIFEHNGEDFSEDNFSSLCKFGYSNKRALHTIGFRGIGFKSTFSLGDRVNLFTPSLSVYFKKERFTEPCWFSKEVDTLGKTRVIVEIKDTHRLKSVEENLDSWLKNPLSLLFFKNIHKMQIGDQEIHWRNLGTGPVPNSKWMTLNGNKKYLLIQSNDESFPNNALEEIKEERMLGIGEEMNFPPSKIEIVLGAKGLYVVLPTGILTELPFACNAPFIQRPSRQDIKDPEISPTNRWLLKRAGQLAALTMHHWLENTELSTVKRVRAYGLFPDVDRSDLSLAGICGTTVEKAFGKKIENQPLLVTDDGSLVLKNQSSALPSKVLDIWSADQASALFDEKMRPVLSRHITSEDRKKLSSWGMIEQIDKNKIVETLQDKSPPRPETWQQLLNLWMYVGPEITNYNRYHRNYDIKYKIHIVPVEGKGSLYPSNEVVRLEQNIQFQSSSDWKFLVEHLNLVCSDWLLYLDTEKDRADSNVSDGRASKDVETAYAVLASIGLNECSKPNEVINNVATSYFARENGDNLDDCICLAQIAAKVNARVEEEFKFATVDRKLHPATFDILFDKDGSLTDLLPETDRYSLLLHPGYTKEYSACTSEEWLRWVNSGRAGLRTFISLEKFKSFFSSRHKLDEELQRRDFVGDLVSEYHYPTFCIEDWDFAQKYWNYWKFLAKDNPAVWYSIIEHLLSAIEIDWSEIKTAKVTEKARNGRKQKISYDNITPRWAQKLRGLPCLPDKNGDYRKPEELLRRTPETESLMDIEPFVHSEIDRKDSEFLLDLLGVKSKPTGPNDLLKYLRSFANNESLSKSVIQEVEKLYRRLDQMVSFGDTENLKIISQTFKSEKLILTQNGIWETTAGVYITSSEVDVPDAETIRTSVINLDLWSVIGVEDRPTEERVIKWLKSLPSNKPLEKEESHRVQSLLGTYPIPIWNECGCWLNLAGEWVSTCNLSYSLTMQTLIKWQHLFPKVKQETANFINLQLELTKKPPFSKLPTLASSIQEHLNDGQNTTRLDSENKWLTKLGNALCRVKFDSKDDTENVRDLASSLAYTESIEVQGLKVTPYINGKPVGTPLQTEVVWLQDQKKLYINKGLSRAKLAKLIPEVIAKAFDRNDISAALNYCYERDPNIIFEYLNENFELQPQNGNEPIEPKGSDGNGMPPDIPTIIVPNGEEGGGYVEVGRQGRTTVGGSSNSKKNMFEIYAESQGFKRTGKNTYFRKDDGSKIIRESKTALFPWEYRSSDGSLEQYYKPISHQLDQLELDYSVWNLLETDPKVYTLILYDQKSKNSLLELTGLRICKMFENGEFDLHPATYRLVVNETGGKS